MDGTAKGVHPLLPRVVKPFRRGILSFISLGIMFFAGSVTAGERDWVLVKAPIKYTENLELPPAYADTRSALLTSDGYIVFKSASPTPLFEMVDGMPRNTVRLHPSRLDPDEIRSGYFGAFKYYAIDCKRKRWVSSRNLPDFKTTWIDYTVDDGEFDYDWPRNVERALCTGRQARSIRHTVDEVMFLNSNPGGSAGAEPLDYDKAVSIGVLK